MLMRREEVAQKELISMDSYVAGGHARRHPLWGFYRDIEHMIRLWVFDSRRRARHALSLDRTRLICHVWQRLEPNMGALLQ